MAAQVPNKKGRLKAMIDFERYCSNVDMIRRVFDKTVELREETVQLMTAAKSLQSCPTLCDPIDRSPPGSPSLRVSRQEQWSGLPFPSPVHESEK